MTEFKRVALIGCGLIGGSLVSAWRRAGIASEVVACDISEESAAEAVQIGLADSFAMDPARAVRGADVVVVAVPVSAMRSIFAAIAPELAAGAIVTDVGSTRTSVIAAARQCLGSAFRRYVPVHPIAGAEKSGIHAIQPDLFSGKNAISTPDAGVDPQALSWMESAWERIGAHVVRMDAAEHDRVMAAVSHLPHVLAFALVDMIACGDRPQSCFGLAGAGFRDFTRIAASSSVMWRDICVENREAISRELRMYRSKLDMLQEAIDRGDRNAVEEVFNRASIERRRFGERLDRERSHGH